MGDPSFFEEVARTVFEQKRPEKSHYSQRSFLGDTH